MSQVSDPRAEYLDRLTDLLPPREVTRVRREVEALILERVAEEMGNHPDIDEPEAERRALEALGPAEQLADEIVSDPMTIPLATRRLFVRALAVVFAGHLLLAVVLTVAGTASAAIPGLLGPLPKEPASAIFLSIMTIFFIDTGIVLCLFVAMGTGRSSRAVSRLYVRYEWTRRGAIEGLVLLALLGVIVNFFLGRVFAVQQGEELQPFLATEVMELVPYVNIVLALFAVRHVLTLLGRGGNASAAAADALACLAGVITLILLATRGEIVTMPAEKLGQEAADVLDNLLERVLLLIAVLGALLLTVRFVRQVIRCWRLMRA